MSKVKYIVIHEERSNFSIEQTTLFENIMIDGGEIMQSWTTNNAVHHLIKYEPKES